MNQIKRGEIKIFNENCIKIVTEMHGQETIDLFTLDEVKCYIQSQIGLVSAEQAKEKDYLIKRITELIKRKQSQPDDEFSDGIISRCNAAIDELLSLLSIFYDYDYFSDHDWQGNEKMR